jgi:uncharacterized membrane-anchored protein
VGALAVVRPDDQNVPLLLHVLGSMVLVGGLLTGASILAFARGERRLLRLGYFSLLFVAVPGWVAMFAGAEWIYREQGLADEPIDSTWVLIGFIAAEGGALLLLISLVLGGIGVRRLRTERGERLLKATMLLAFVLLAANVVAAWAMTAKPD